MRAVPTGVKPTVGSLFAGIGGFDLGLERAGFETRWQVEIDPFCRRVLAKHWPDIPRYGDICGLTGATLSPVDVLCGGFPCQDISVAGKGAGIEGSRSGLWSEYARLIGEIRPRYVIVENVAALLRRGLGRVLGDLAALGYDAEWDCLPASAFGAPHQRDRLWIVAYPRGAAGGLAERRSGRQGRQPSDSRESALVRQGDGSCGSEGFAPCGREGTLAHAEGQCCQLRAAPGERSGRPSGSGDTEAPHAHGQPTLGVAEPRSQRGYWATEPDVGRVADGIPARVDRLRSLGNALVPQIAEWIGRRILTYERDHLSAA